MEKNTISEMLDNVDMLDIIFKAREDELGKTTEEDKKNLKAIKSEINIKYVAYKNALDNIPNGFTNIKREIIDKFNEYIESINRREGYYNEKYYKEGLKDGLRLLSKCF